MVAGAPRRHRPPGQDQSCRPEPPERHERQGDRGGAAREVRAPGVRAERGDRPAVPGALARAEVFPVLFRRRAAGRRSRRRALASPPAEDPGGLAGHFGVRGRDPSLRLPHARDRLPGEPLRNHRDHRVASVPGAQRGDGRAHLRASAGEAIEEAWLVGPETSNHPGSRRRARLRRARPGRRPFARGAPGRALRLRGHHPALCEIPARRRAGRWMAAAGLQANAEQLPLRDASIDLAVDNENLADMTPVKLTKREVEAGKGASPLHQEALEWIRRAKLSLGAEVPEDFIFNLGPVRFVAELWRVLKPGGRAILVEFGIEEGFSAPVKLPGHTEYEVQYSHLRQVARFLGFQEKFGALPLFLNMRPDTRVLCTGAAYAIRRFCEAAGRPFAIRAYTESEFRHALGDMLPKLSGHHFHDISDPAWFGLWDFKVLLLEKPTAAPGPRPAIKDVKGFRWGGMR